MRAQLMVATTLLLSACGQPASNEQAQPAPRGSAEQTQMHQLNDMDRAITLKRAIYASGYACKRIVQSGYVQEYGNLSMWAANCADKRSWAIFIGPDASVQVRDCKDMARYKLPACVIREEKKSAAA